MLQVAGEGPIKVEFDNFEHGFPEGFGPGRWGHLGYGIGNARKCVVFDEATINAHDSPSALRAPGGSALRFVAEFEHPPRASDRTRRVSCDA